jgi:hypothetical protein
MHPKRPYLRRPKKAIAILQLLKGRKYRDGDTPNVYKPLTDYSIKTVAGAKKEKHEQITFHHQAC